MTCDTCEYWAFDSKINYCDDEEYGICKVTFGTAVVVVSDSGIDHIITPGRFFCASYSEEQ